MPYSCSYFSAFLGADVDSYGGAWEMLTEGFMPSFGLFLVRSACVEAVVPQVPNQPTHTVAVVGCSCLGPSCTQLCITQESWTARSKDNTTPSCWFNCFTHATGTFSTAHYCIM